MQFRFPSCLLLLLCLSVAGTARAQQPARSRPAGPAPAQPAASTALPGTVPANYRLSPNDLVRVQVFQEDDMDWTVRVSKDGTLALPLVGAVNVNQKTPDELGAIVRDRLLDGYLAHPQVSVTVQDFAKRRFTILGQVQKPGQIDFPDNTSLNILQVIGMAGGYTRNADPGRVVIKRAVGGKDIVLRVDARRMAKDPAATPFEILPGDTISVYEVLF